jgi:hypothetical protein
MLWVGGGILLHGLEELHLIDPVVELIHDLAHRIGSGIAILEWLINALASAIVGLVIGGIIVVIVRRFTKHPEELIVD